MKKIVGREQKQIMTKPKKKGITTANTTRSTKIGKNRFIDNDADDGPMKVEVYNCKQNDHHPGRLVKMENAEELRNQRNSPPRARLTTRFWEFPIIHHLWHNQIILDNTAGRIS
jgi:hypothetical protein